MTSFLAIYVYTSESSFTWLIPRMHECKLESGTVMRTFKVDSSHTGISREIPNISAQLDTLMRQDIVVIRCVVYIVVICCVVYLSSLAISTSHFPNTRCSESPCLDNLKLFVTPNVISFDASSLDTPNVISFDASSLEISTSADIDGWNMYNHGAYRDCHAWHSQGDQKWRW